MVPIPSIDGQHPKAGHRHLAHAANMVTGAEYEVTGGDSAKDI
jgi:hypothetical protein